MASQKFNDWYQKSETNIHLHSHEAIGLPNNPVNHNHEDIVIHKTKEIKLKIRNKLIMANVILQTSHSTTRVLM